MIVRLPCRQCRQCRAALHDADKRALFCSTSCRKTWNNVRMTRGAELYDLLMILRFERTSAKAMSIWSLICRMASVWKEEDDRANRRSFGEPQEVRQRMVRYLGTRIG